MLARVGDQIFAVPQAAVREVAEFEADAIRALQGAEVVEFRGAPLPILRLSKDLGIATSDATRLPRLHRRHRRRAVGLLVDRIVGHREIVVPIPPPIR
jgi:two-component system chemotaxis sensor kinase CheA